jgi:hypothetical protein
MILGCWLWINKSKLREREDTTTPEAFYLRQTALLVLSYIVKGLLMFCSYGIPIIFLTQS